MMDSVGTDIQMLSSPMVPGQPTSMTVDQTRWISEHTAALAEASAGRLSGLAVTPLTELEQIADEMRRAVDQHGYHALHLTTTADGIPLHLPQFAGLWATMEELGLFGVMHPMTGMVRPRLDDCSLRILIDWPQEITTAIGRLIYSGVLERHPQLRLCLCHGGGTLPYLRGRLDRRYSAPQYETKPDCRAHISQVPSAYLDRLYYDTCVASPEALAYLVGLMGADSVWSARTTPSKSATRTWRRRNRPSRSCNSVRARRCWAGTSRGFFRIGRAKRRPLRRIQSASTAHPRRQSC